jgi:hypothetical protein
MPSRWCSLHGAWCVSRALRGPGFADGCGGFHAARCMLYVACCMLHAACGPVCVLHVVQCWLAVCHAACCLLHGSRCCCMLSLHAVCFACCIPITCPGAHFDSRGYSGYPQGYYQRHAGTHTRVCCARSAAVPHAAWLSAAGGRVHNARCNAASRTMVRVSVARRSAWPVVSCSVLQCYHCVVACCIVACFSLLLCAICCMFSVFHVACCVPFKVHAV